jgi:hypothetical protein
MRRITPFTITLIMLLMSVKSVLAQGEPPTVPTPASTTPAAIALTGGFPWALILVFIAAGYIISTIKKHTPDNVITASCCVPLIDEKKMEIEKQKIAEEEAALKGSGKA